MYKPDHRKGAFIWLSVFFQIITMNAQVQVDVLNAVGIYFGKRRIRIAVMEHGKMKGDLFEGYDHLCSFIGIGSDTIRYHMNTEDIRDRRFPYIENIRDCLNRNDMELSIGASKQIIPSRFGAEAILAHIKEAVANIRETIRDVVLTVPLNSTRRYRENLIKAAMSQGFNVISILSEPAAIVNEYIHITGSQDYLNLLNELYYILTYYMNEDGYECTLIQVNNRQCTIYDSCSGTIASISLRGN